jgi:hypothetical protein
MEGEGYPKYRIFSVKRALWRYKKAFACLIHVRKDRNLAVAKGRAPVLLPRTRHPYSRSGFSREKREGREGVVLFSDGPGFREHLDNFAKLASFAAKAASTCVQLMQ